jgi:hypothetical protein
MDSRVRPPRSSRRTRGNISPAVLQLGARETALLPVDLKLRLESICKLCGPGPEREAGSHVADSAALHGSTPSMYVASLSSEIFRSAGASFLSTMSDPRMSSWKSPAKSKTTRKGCLRLRKNRIHPVTLPGTRSKAHHQ